MTEPRDQAGVDLSRAFAQWIDRSTLVWNTPVGGSFSWALEYTPGTSADDIVTDHGSTIMLSGPANGLPKRLHGKHPHLMTHQCFDVAASNAAQLRDALTSPLIATQRDGQGRLLAATGVQIAGVLDDLFAAAAGERLGQHGTMRTRGWRCGPLQPAR